MTALSLIALGLAVGVLSGALGIGGGVLLVPALMWLGSYDDQRRAQGITLAVLTLPVLLPGVYRYYAQGLIRGEDLLTGAWIALGVAVGVFGGASVVSYVPVPTLRLLFGLTLIFIAVRFLLASDDHTRASFIGLAATGLACLAYLALRTLGRRHAPPPSLGARIQSVKPAGTQPGDYSI